MQERRVALRGGHGTPSNVAAERRAEGLLRGHPLCDDVRRVVAVGGHLDRQLAAAGQCAGQAREQIVMVVDPVQRGVGEYEVDRLRGRPARDVAEREAHAVAGVLAAPLEHGRRGVEADRPRGASPLVQRARELARPAAEVDDTAAGTRIHQVEQIEEGRRPLARELLVAGGVPAVAHRCSSVSQYAMSRSYSATWPRASTACWAGSPAAASRSMKATSSRSLATALLSTWPVVMAGSP